MACLYCDRRATIGWEDEHVICDRKTSIPRFLEVGMNNYASEAGNLIANINAGFPAHVAHIATHNRTCREMQAREAYRSTLLNTIICK